MGLWAALGIAVVVEVLGPLLVAALVWWRVRREPGRTWANGVLGFLCGVVLFMVVVALKTAVRRLGLVPAPAFGMVYALEIGAFSGVIEEVVRVGAAFVLFRRAGVARPLLAAAFF